MRILFLVKHLNAGGITSYLLNLSKGLMANGYDVHILSSGGNMQDSFKTENVNLLTVDLKTKSELHLKIYLSLPKIAHYIKQKDIDILHAHTRVTQVMAQILSWHTKKPFVSTCHGYFKNRLGRRIFPCWGDKVFAISEAVESHLVRDLKVCSQKVCLVKSGIDVDWFSHKEKSSVNILRQEYHLENKKIIGLVGRLSDVKGQDILIRAMKEIIKERKDVQLLLVGEGKMEKAFKDLAQDLGLEECVTFIPEVNRTRDFLHLFDIAVMPSRQEGLGLAILEAQASSCPVIATRVGGIPNIVEHYQTGMMFEKEDVFGLAKEILNVLENDMLREKICKEAFRQVQTMYGLELMLEKIMDVYQNIIVLGR